MLLDPQFYIFSSRFPCFHWWAKSQHVSQKIKLLYMHCFEISGSTIIDWYYTEIWIFFWGVEGVGLFSCLFLKLAINIIVGQIYPTWSKCEGVELVWTQNQTFLFAFEYALSQTESRRQMITRPWYHSTTLLPDCSKLR